jgi:peroxiredoxin
MARATRELIETSQPERARKAGEVAPPFELLGPDRRTHRFESLLRQGPLVVSFYRGGWCPYCNVELRALERARPSMEARGATLIAVSMQTPDQSQKIAQRLRLGFPILTDAGGVLAGAFGLRFKLPSYLVKVYKETFGTDLAVINGDGSWTLPMPARYVIGQDGVIAYAEVNADYTRRPDPSELFPTLDRLLRAA